MNVGFSWFSSGGVGQDSLAFVREATRVVLAAGHTLKPYPVDAAAASTAQQRDRLKQWAAGCDVIVGPVDAFFQPWLRRLRLELGERPVPYVAFLLGCMPRGGVEYAEKWFQTCDVLLANCEADAALASKFWPNATVRCVPFAYDGASFYRDDEAARVMRENLGFAPDEKMVLYAGRVTIEKNVHTLLKVFRVVLDAVPDARLVIAGREDSIPFIEFGVVPLDIKRWLLRLAASLGLNDRQVTFAGHRARHDLRALYSAADVFVNLTLHHDENFGLAQVEAMACGLPVVGTTWGGLKDTIAPGDTGLQAPAVVTAIGVKVDWWQAANHVVRLFAANEENRQLRARCRDIVRDRYSLAAYGEALDRVLQEAVDAARCPSDPLRPSAFAQEFWATCLVIPEGKRLGTIGRRFYNHGPESMRLYRELIAPFATAPMNGAISEAACAWCFAAPVVMRADDVVVVNDPLYPFVISVPRNLVDRVRVLVDRFTLQPVMSARSLDSTSPAATDVEALAWMEETGLLIRTCAGAIDMACAASVGRAPGVEIRQVDAEADIVWLC
jgi:glycosyltransferase involved in cell wall biosynthesis